MDGLDEHIMGTRDPKAPFNEDTSGFDKWYAALELEDAMDHLKAYESGYGEWCALSGRDIDDPDSMEAYVEANEEQLFEYYNEYVKEEE